MDEQAMQQFRAEVIARKNLPTIPTVLAKILQLVDRENASGRELVDVIEHDQALTGKMLRLANSAFFGQARRVATIPRSVVLLGFSTVRNLALGVKVWDSLSTGIARPRLEELWAHSVGVAAATKLLASRLRSGDPDEGFTAGLLHDVGRLVLAMKFREHYWEVVGAGDASQTIDALEAGNFGVDHAEVGGWLLESWSLPPTIVEAVRAHHTALGRPGLPGVLAATNRLIEGTDFETGAVDVATQAVFETTAERGVTGQVWAEVVAELNDGALTALGRLEG
jgi:putative nucleotidyltransferase with HDIG domain